MKAWCELSSLGLQVHSPSAGPPRAERAAVPGAPGAPGLLPLSAAFTPRDARCSAVALGLVLLAEDRAALPTLSQQVVSVLCGVTSSQEPPPGESHGPELFPDAPQLARVPPESELGSLQLQIPGGHMAG